MIIDSHSHYLPKEILKWASFYPLSFSDMKTRIKVMDEAGIDKALLTYPTTDAATAAGVSETKIARLFNDGVGEIIRKYPKRFLGTAVIVPGDKKEMLKELERAINKLGLKGISLASSYQGIYLDDERFWPLYERVMELDIPIFVHTTTQGPIGSERLQHPLLTPVIEYVFDITVSIGKLITSGVLDKFSGLKFVFAHFGGVVPFIRDRFDTIYKMLFGLQVIEKLPKLPSDYLKEIYVDISGSSLKDAIYSTLETVKLEHLLWGSDYPSNARPSSSLKAVGDLDIPDKDKEKILGGNIWKLLAERG
jgi:predicted TIM-barrel fold metal-dependent hydrolase